MTPGRALYEFSGPSVPWEELSAEDRQWWEDRFSAGLRAFEPDLYGQLYRERNELLGKLDAVRELCEAKAGEASRDLGIPVAPRYVRVSGADVLAAIGKLP